MRIVHIDTGRELRGGQRQLLLLAEGLRQRGHEQVILAREGAPLYRESGAREFETAPATGAALRRRQADLVHAHDGRGHTLAALAAGRSPIVVSRRVAFPVGTGWISRWKYGRASRFLAVSEYVKRQLLAADIPEEKISVVYDGVRLPQAASPRERVALAPASDDPQKGSRLAADACRQAGVELRFSSALEDELPCAALFVYLSYSEGLGSAILLAMACGTPVVASRVGGIPEIVEHERTGLLVENTVEAVAEAVCRVLDDPQGAASRAEAARAQVLARFTDTIMLANTEQAYNLALS